VVESARPRALAQLGIDAERFVAARAGRVWLSITGYGRGDAAPGRVAFGDDAAVAAGAAHAVADDAGPLFCADAIADPLTGLHAALAAWACWRSGGGALLDLALCDVTAHALAFAPGDACEVSGTAQRAVVRVGDDVAEVAPPRAREASARARAPGVDTDALRVELAC
jgi:crotonobetainyl-CoA:carnitine CoA-transferase CaiB-like acyl-CoA transferase